jgi:aspartate kinase
MKVFKFGGASVKDAPSFLNVCDLLANNTNGALWVVVSAIGKTTNLLEQIHADWRKGNTQTALWEQLMLSHQNIASDLGIDHPEAGWRKIWLELVALKDVPPTAHFDASYDQWVSFGELLSTQMLSDLCHSKGLHNQWIDARTWLKTDLRFRDARVQWSETIAEIKKIPSHTLSITQGFIGSAGNQTTTLGREGSDYTAAIIAHCLEAEALVIWKDVPGMLNADPKKFADAEFIPQLSFQEALELAYYGASVIHPKTIQPLQSKNIPLYIQSFLHPNDKGTLIHQCQDIQYPVCTILKENQTLLSITTRDGSFIVEDNILEIFQELNQIGIKVQLMENSALSFSLCVQAEKDKLDALCDKLKSRYILKFNYPVTLVTLRHYQERDLKKWEGESILLEQKNRTTVRWVLSK